jgi:hypothetical protein
MGGCCGSFAKQKENVELGNIAPGYSKNRQVLQRQQKTWEATGVVSLRDSRLEVSRP